MIIYRIVNRKKIDFWMMILQKKPRISKELNLILEFVQSKMIYMEGNRFIIIINKAIMIIMIIKDNLVNNQF